MQQQTVLVFKKNFIFDIIILIRLRSRQPQPPAKAVMAHGWHLAMIQYAFHISQKALDVFQE